MRLWHVQLKSFCHYKHVENGDELAVILHEWLAIGPMAFSMVSTTIVSSFFLWQIFGIGNCKQIFYLSFFFAIIRALVEFIQHRRTWAQYVSCDLGRLEVTM